MRGLIKHYRLRLDHKLGHGKCAIQIIPCEYISCTTMLKNTWAYKVDPKQQSCYQHVAEGTYWPVLGPFNNRNIIKFANKTTSSE